MPSDPEGPFHKAPLRSQVRPKRFAAPHRRERDRVLDQYPEIHGFLPLLMKQRNGGRWADHERHDLHWRLKRFVHISPYLALLLVPGSIVFLPVIAWWLDRRDAARSGKPA